MKRDDDGNITFKTIHDWLIEQYPNFYESGKRKFPKTDEASDQYDSLEMCDKELISLRTALNNSTESHDLTKRLRKVADVALSKKVKEMTALQASVEVKEMQRLKRDVELLNDKLTTIGQQTSTLSVSGDDQQRVDELTAQIVELETRLGNVKKDRDTIEIGKTRADNENLRMRDVFKSLVKSIPEEFK